MSSCGFHINTSAVLDQQTVQDSLAPAARVSCRGLKVCHVVATTEGAPWMFEQLRELRNRYHCEVTALISGNSGLLVDRLDSERIPHFAANFTFGSFRSILNMPREILRLARFFRQQRFDVVQTHIFMSMIFGRVAAWLADVPVRLSMISGPYHLRARTFRWIERSTWRMETRLVPSCEESLRLCRELGVDQDRLSLVYYSADEENFDPAKVQSAGIRDHYGWKNETPVVGMVAVFYPPLPESRWVPAHLHGRGVKGHEDFVRSAVHVLKEFPDAKFLMVGSGWGEAGDEYMNTLKKLVQELNLEEHVIFAGYRSDVRGILADVDVAVQASLDENLGGTLEALLLERPLVTTRVGGMVDVVKDGQTGVLVNPSDPSDLARGISEMLGNRERATALGQNGRQFVLGRFSLRRTTDDLAQLYASLYAAERSRRRFHKASVTLWRAVLAVPLLAFLGFRLLFFEMILPIYVPVYFARVRQIGLRLVYLPFSLYAIGRAYFCVSLCLLYRAYSRLRSATVRRQSDSSRLNDCDHVVSTLNDSECP